MELRRPSVGPILGFTTDQHARIMIRGQNINNAAALAVIRYRRVGELKWSTAHFATLTAEDDMTGVIVLNGLQEGMKYAYQAGWCIPSTSQMPQEIQLEWPDEEHIFWTRSNKANAKRSYIIGSCRYLRLTGGIADDPSTGDQIFDTIYQQSPLTDGIMMMGDQIYADDLNFAFPDTELPHFLLKYRTAFSQPYIRRLMSSIPTYMILDDHEIEDNWPAKRSNSDNLLYHNATHAYELYQASHSPACRLTRAGTINRKIEHYWYTFTDGEIDWFVMDARTERNLSPDDRTILGGQQKEEMFKWLINSNAKVKFIVSSVMFCPDKQNDGNDTWKSFPAQRNEILETLRTKNIKNVFILSGDVHGSMISKMTHSASTEFALHAITASPFFKIPLIPHAKAKDFILDQPLSHAGGGVYSQTLVSKVISQDNFARINIERDTLQVSYYSVKGDTLESVTIPLL